LKLAYSKSFRTHRASKRATSNKSVHWWTEELTLMRKKLNAPRRRCQRTRNNEDLRQQYKTQYLEGKARFTATIKKKSVHGGNIATGPHRPIPGSKYIN
jgi:hypothetical protein